MRAEKQIEDQSLQHIHIVIEEREKLVQACQELVPMLKDFEKTTSVEAQKKMLEVSEHLANIGGFCDSWTQNQIVVIKKGLALAMLNTIFYSQLKAILPFIVGIQVDFNKKPFRLIGLDLKALGAELKTIIKR